MERYIDAQLAKEALTGWETDPLDEEIERTIDNIPTADVAPKSEVAREIFDELDGRLDKICIVANKETEYSSFIGVVQQVFDAVGVVIAELKKKYTEEQI